MAIVKRLDTEKYGQALRAAELMIGQEEDKQSAAKKIAVLATGPLFVDFQPNS